MGEQAEGRPAPVSVDEASASTAQVSVEPFLRCRQVQLALLLREAGVAFVIVGGAARFLRGAVRMPRDLDLVVRGDDLSDLQAALVPRAPGALSLRRGIAGPQRVRTAWSEVDVFVREVLPPWKAVVVDGVTVPVADD